MTKTEGTPQAQCTTWGHQNRTDLSGTANGTADGSLTFTAQQMAMLNACLTDSDGNAEGRLNELDNGSAEGSPDLLGWRPFTWQGITNFAQETVRAPR
jgi:hypothetical protein